MVRAIILAQLAVRAEELGSQHPATAPRGNNHYQIDHELGRSTLNHFGRDYDLRRGRRRWSERFDSSLEARPGSARGGCGDAGRAWGGEAGRIGE